VKRYSKSIFSCAALVMALTVALAAQDGGTVKVTVARANIRAEASETSKILAQVTQGMELDLVAVEGDWFHVRVPVSGLRVEAFISKKVAKIAKVAAPPPPSGATVAGRPGVASAPSASTAERNGMSVVMMNGPASTQLLPHQLHIVQVGDKIDSLAKGAPVVPATGQSAGSDASATFVWVADGPSSAQVVSDRRPAFLGVFKDLVGLNPDDLMPVLVRVTPAASGVRLVAALRGRGDQATRTDPDWDVVRDLKQDIVKTDVQRLDRGAVRITPTAPLDPGEYAIVFRLATKKKVAGATLLGAEGEGKVFATAWDFAVK
jgi:hypothetical protein